MNHSFIKNIRKYTQIPISSKLNQYLLNTGIIQNTRANKYFLVMRRVIKYINRETISHLMIHSLQYHSKDSNPRKIKYSILCFSNLFDLTNFPPILLFLFNILQNKIRNYHLKQIIVIAQFGSRLYYRRINKTSQQKE